MKYWMWVVSTILVACSGTPKNIDSASPLQLEPYLGTWYEIVRQDHAFEEGLSNVIATYSMNADGSIDVVNRGYSSDDRSWREAKGKANFVNSSGVGYLKVSFFGPFYGAYVIFELDNKDSQYAIISGASDEFFWLFSRTPTMPEAVKQRLLNKARQLGFQMDKLVYVQHSYGTP